MNKKLKNFYEYYKYLDNPTKSLLFKFGIKKECEIKIKNSNEKITLHSVESLNKLMNNLPKTSKNKLNQLIKYINDVENNEEIVTIEDIKFFNVFNNEFKKNHPETYTIFIEEFFSDDQWDMINFNNRYVIDIGGNVADTALYFAKENATVISFEPVKHFYELGLENISLNPHLKEKITFINKAAGGKKGKINILTGSTKGYSDNSYDIEVITINDILNDYEFPADVLKMDCEGCEFEIIQNEDLSMFNDIIFEHHSKIAGKDYKPLITALKNQGFKIDTFPCNASGLDFEDIGIIHAYK